ncbi:Uncharacterised protein [Halioglobus japonicus]|nr:Uncharacterised protein [Halioglobus japonicus]
MQLDSEDPALTALFDIVSEPLALVRPESRQALGECEVYVLPFPLCTAYSTRRDDRRIIIVGSGLLDLIETTAYSAHVIGALPHAADTCYPISALPDQTLANLFNTLVMTLLHHYFTGEGGLPNMKGLATPAMAHEARISSAGGIAFILLHELAHLEHHFGDAPIALDLSAGAAIEESLTPQQRQEHEADQIALDYLEPQWQDVGHFYLHSAFDFFTRLDLLSGQFQKTHPLTLNRLFHLDARVPPSARFYDADRRHRINQILATAFADTTARYSQGPDHVLNLRRETCLAILGLLRDPLLALGGPDVGVLFDGPGPSWQATLAMNGNPWRAPQT